MTEKLSSQDKKMTFVSNLEKQKEAQFLNP